MKSGLNRIPQFVTEIDGQRIHFFHARSSREDAPALLLTHGFPSSNVEFARLIELLTNPSDGPAFHVVAPSLPGYGFSTPLSGPGWSMGRTGERVDRAHAPPRIRAVRRARRRHRRRRVRDGGEPRSGPRHRDARGDGPDDGGERGDVHPRDGGQPGCLGSDRPAHPRADGRVPQRHLRLPRDPEHAAADDRVWPDGFADLPPRVDRREARRTGRTSRSSATSLLTLVSVAWFGARGRVGGAHALRPGPLERVGRTVTVPQACGRLRRRRDRAPGDARSPRTRAGPSTSAVCTSPRWNCRRCSPRTCRSSSGRWGRESLRPGRRIGYLRGRASQAARSCPHACVETAPTVASARSPRARSVRTA